jgi:hypothetical protein
VGILPSTTGDLSPLTGYPMTLDKITPVLNSGGQHRGDLV